MPAMAAAVTVPAAAVEEAEGKGWARAGTGLAAQWAVCLVVIRGCDNGGGLLGRHTESRLLLGCSGPSLSVT